MGLGVALLALAALGLPASAFAASQTFVFAGKVQQQFTVPDGVSKFTIVAIGAQGGGNPPSPPLANAGEVIAPMSGVKPGDTYSVIVGGEGGTNTVSGGGTTGGGFNGGGGSDLQGGFGGGGASTVCVGSGSCSNASALVIAGGAGGAGPLANGGVGGRTGGNGGGFDGGQGATPTAGGAGGITDDQGVGAADGAQGSAAQGGFGADGPCAGGGGGGGAFGGGGGGTSSNGCGGGGGGSSIGPGGSTFLSNVAPDTTAKAAGGGEVAFFFETSALSSTPSRASLTFGDSLTDSATVTTDGGVGPPTGSVEFFACGPLASASGCQDGGTEFDPGEMVNGTDDSPSVSSTLFTPPAAGIWCLRAEYSGDDNYPPSSDSSANECVTVAKASTSTASAPTTPSIVLGASGADSVTDRASISGFVNSTIEGSVNFFVCGPLASASGCSQDSTQVGAAVNVGSDGTATSAAFTPTKAGTWCFFAVYSGSSDYIGSQDGSAAECFTVAQADTTTSSQPSSTAITLGQTGADSLTDTATVTGNLDGGSPTGHVNFFICGPTATTCTDETDQVGGDLPVTAGAGNTATATSDTFTPTSPGTWCFFAVYSGDSNYNASRDGSPTECFTVAKGDTTTSSQPSSATITLGQTGADSLTDTATTTGNADGGSPTGHVDFFICGPGATTCTDQSAPVGDDVPLTAGAGNTATATSSTFTPTQAGTWCFFAVYSGDSDYIASQDGSAAECFTVAQADTTTSSQPSSAAITLGQMGADSLTDTATTTGNPVGGSPTGHVDFFICGPTATTCTDETDQIGDDVPVTAGAGNTTTATSDAFTPRKAGTWCFLAVYSGDGNYNPSHDGSATECFTVATADTTTSSQPSSATITLGQTGADSLTDTATTTGNADGGSPTGHVDFFICGPAATTCTDQSTQVGDDVALSAAAGNTAAATSDAFTPRKAGTWCFLAVYSGDSNYNRSHDGSATECFTVAKAGVSASSKPQSAATTLVAGDRDAVTITGNADGGSPTGTVAFSVCGPLASASGCTSGGRQLGEAIALTAGSGDRATAASDTFTPPAPGIWCFRAAYSGDSDYVAAADGGAAECFTVAVPDKPSITLTSPQDGTAYRLGQRVNAAYSCADSAGGPGIASCEGTIGDGGQLGTSKPGRFAFTVTATSKDGEQTVVTTHYRVRSSTSYKITSVKGHRNGHVRLRVRTSGPGVINVLVTDWLDNAARVANVKVLQPASHRFVWARARLIVRRAGTHRFDIAPNRHARLVLEHPRYKVRLRVWVTFAAPGERQRKVGFSGIRLTS